jgi:Kelch motif protein
MIKPHAYHTATLLPDGHVLIAGGLVNDRLDGNISASAELFEPTSGGAWTAARPMIEARWGHTATLLQDGTVLVAGSYVNSGDPLASAELYDPGTGRWTATGTMRHGRGGHTATLLRDGRVLVVGGGAEDTSLEGGPRSATAELYDPDTGRWTATGSMRQARTAFTATRLADGRVLVAGGDGDFTAAELYDPDTDRWSATGSMAQGRIGHTATLMPDGSVLVTGGCACSDPGAGERASAELYEPGSGRWAATASMAKARIFHTATLLADGHVLVVNDGLDDRPASAELYDASSGRWTNTARPARGRVGYTATLLLDGMVLLAGDYSRNILATELYDPGTGT